MSIFVCFKCKEIYIDELIKINKVSMDVFGEGIREVGLI